MNVLKPVLSFVKGDVRGKVPGQKLPSQGANDEKRKTMESPSVLGLS